MTDRLGFSFPFEGLPLPAHREFLQSAASKGYTDAWTPEVGGTEAFSCLAVAAAWTQDLRLGTAVANVFTRAPGLMSMSIATVAELAPGRLCVGLGASSPAIVTGWNGLTYERPLSRVREVVKFLRSALAGEKASSDSLGIRGFRLARPLGEPPKIYLAALRPKMLALAGAVADGVILTWLAPSDVPMAIDAVQQGARDAGRSLNDFDYVCSLPVLAADDEAAARQMARRLVAAYLTTPVYAPYQEWLGRGSLLAPVKEAWDAGDRRAAVGLVSDELVDLLLIGSPVECRQRIDDFRRAGVTTPILEFTPTAGEPLAQAEQSIRLWETYAND